LKKSIIANDTLYNAKVQLERLGEVMLPEEILIHFNNGDQILETWDGKSRFKDFNYTEPEKLTG